MCRFDSPLEEHTLSPIVMDMACLNPMFTVPIEALVGCSECRAILALPSGVCVGILCDPDGVDPLARRILELRGESPCPPFEGPIVGFSAKDKAEMQSDTALPPLDGHLYRALWSLSPLESDLEGPSAAPWHGMEE